MDERLRQTMATFRGNRRKALQERGAISRGQVLSDVPLIFKDPALMEGIELAPEEIIAALDLEYIAQTRRSALTERWALRSLATAMTGHEINSSLSSLAAVVQRAAEAAPDDSGLRYAKAIVDRFRETLHFVNRFSNPSESKRYGTPMQSLTSVNKEFSRLASSGNFEIEITEAFRTSDAQFNSLLIDFVLVNLIRNAIYWSSQKNDRGRIIVRLDLETRVWIDNEGDERSEAVIRVEDNGPGIANDKREKIFEPEYSGRGSTGIGLHLCRANLEAGYKTIVVDDKPSELGGAVFLIGSKAALLSSASSKDKTIELGLVLESLAVMVEDGNVPELEKWSQIYEEGCGLAMRLTLRGGLSGSERALVTAVDRIADALRAYGRAG